MACCNYVYFITSIHLVAAVCMGLADTHGKSQICALYVKQEALLHDVIGVCR
jgi:hypothetical protein